MKKTKNNITYHGMLKASSYIINKKLNGEITKKGLKIPKEDIKNLKQEAKKIFSNPKRTHNLIKKEKKLMKEVDKSIEEGKTDKALKKGEELVGIIFWTLHFREITCNEFHKKLNEFLGKEKNKEQITQTWLKLITPTKELYLDKMVKELTKGNKPKFIEHLKLREELENIPKIKKEKNRSIAYEELDKISKHLTEKQKKEIEEWIKIITNLQQIGELKNYYWPIIESLKKEIN